MACFEINQSSGTHSNSIKLRSEFIAPRKTTNMSQLDLLMLLLLLLLFSLLVPFVAKYFEIFYWIRQKRDKERVTMVDNKLSLRLHDEVLIFRANKFCIEKKKQNQPDHRKCARLSARPNLCSPASEHGSTPKSSYYAR